MRGTDCSIAAEQAAPVCNEPPVLGAAWREGCGGQCSAGAACVWGWDVSAHVAPPGTPPSPHTSQLSAPAQVKSVNLSDGEVLSIRGVDGDALVVLANQTLLVEGQVIRSPTNTISVYFRTFQDEVVGTFQLHYQGRCLPATGEPGELGRGVSPTGLRGGRVPGCRSAACPCSEHRLGWVDSSLRCAQSRGSDGHRCPGPQRWPCSSHPPCPAAVPTQQLFPPRPRLQVYFFLAER